MRINYVNIDYVINILNIDIKINMYVCFIIVDIGLVRVIGNVIFFKCSEIIIRVKIFRCVEGEEVLLEFVLVLVFKYIIVVKCIVMVYNYGVYLKVMNFIYNDINFIYN